MPQRCLTCAFLLLKLSFCFNRQLVEGPAQGRPLCDQYFVDDIVPPFAPFRGRADASASVRLFLLVRKNSERRVYIVKRNLLVWDNPWAVP